MNHQIYSTGSFLQVVFHGVQFGGDDGFNLFNNGDFFGSLLGVFLVFVSPFFALVDFGLFFFLGSLDVGNGFGQSSLL